MAHRPQSCIKCGLRLVENSGCAEQPHVPSVPGTALTRRDKIGEVFKGVVSDWFRASWPVVVHLQSHPEIAASLECKFKRVGNGGHRFPVCPCVVTLGSHEKGSTFMQIFQD